MRKADRFALSRSGASSPLGKLDDRIESFRIEGEVKARIAQAAAAEGKPPAEFIRDVMRVIAFGPEAVKRMHCDSVDRVVEMLSGKLGGKNK